jgi:hypothetical protein
VGTGGKQHLLCQLTASVNRVKMAGLYGGVPNVQTEIDADETCETKQLWKGVLEG